MKRASKSFWLLALLAGMPLLSCPKEQPQALLVMAAAAVTRQMQCTFPGTGAAPQFIWEYGTLDLAVTNQYWLFLYFRNMLASLQQVTGEGPQSLYPTETNYVYVHSAHVRVNLGEFYSVVTRPEDFATMESLRIDGFRWDTALSVGPQEPGVVAIQAIQPDVGNMLYNLITSQTKATNPAIWISVIVKLEGRTQDLWTVYSNEFRFPIRVCLGCLIRPVTNDPTQPPTGANVPCYPGQDEGVDNNLCALIALHKDYCFPGD